MDSATWCWPPAAASPAKSAPGRPATGPSARAGAVRNRLLRLRQHWRDLIGITDVEQRTFGNLARHLSRCEVHDKQRLPAFNLLRISPLLFHADENGALVVAEIDTQPYELLRMRHVLDSENGPDADVDLVEVRGGDEGFDGRRIHVPLFAEARSIASNSV